jgi:hypothetical protein
LERRKLAELPADATMGKKHDARRAAARRKFVFSNGR